jgi:hypothetical protein
VSKAAHEQADACADAESTVLTLYHWEPNANSGKPMLTLAEKGVEYRSHYLDLLKFDQHQPEYLKINPDGTIPALVHGSRVLTESTPMTEYIDEQFEGPPLRSRARRITPPGCFRSRRSRAPSQRAHLDCRRDLFAG